jgi:isopentenyl-diphosphate delta-isomerase
MPTEQVVLVDEHGTPVGQAAKAEVHHGATPLHLAFSCHLFDPQDRILMTRRALAKQTWPGVWTNSLCGHPQPGEPFHDAIRRRARDEIGVEVSAVQVVLPDFRYHATDASGVRENEFCPVFRALTSDEIHPNPDEVMDHRWVRPVDLARLVSDAPWVLSPWLVQHGPLLPFLRPQEDQ